VVEIKNANAEDNPEINKTLKIIIWILRLYTWGAGLLAIYWLLQKITGHSPETSNVMLILLSAILTGIITWSIIMGMKIGKFDRLCTQFDALASDFKQLTKNFNKLSNNFEKHLIQHNR